MSRFAVAVFAVAFAGCYQPHAEGTRAPTEVVSPPATSTVATPRPAEPRPVEGTVPPATQPASCAFQPSANPAPALVVPTDDSLTQVRSDGSTRVLHTFGAAQGITQGNAIINSIAERNGWVGVSAFLYDPSASQIEVALFDGSGALVWDTVYPSGSDPTLHLSANGTLAVDTWDGKGLLVSASGAAQSLNASPIAEASADGFLPVRQGAVWGSHTFGWMNLASGQVAPLAESLAPDDDQNGIVPAWVGDKLVYRSRQGGSLHLVAETPSGALDLALPNTSSYGPQPMPDSAGAWLLLADQAATPAVWLRANVDTGAVDALTVTPPAGLQAIAGQQLQVLADGSIASAFSDASASTLFTSQDLGATWTAIGAPVPLVPQSYGRTMGATAHGGTTLVRTSDMMGYSYRLDPAQVLRPSANVAATLAGAATVFAPTDGSPALSSDGLCVAFWSGVPDGGSEATLTAYDVASGTQAELLTTRLWGASAYWLR